MEQQHGQVGNTHIHGEGEGGDQKIPIMIRSVSHQDQLGRVIPESQLDKQHQTVGPLTMWQIFKTVSWILDLEMSIL